MVGSEFLTLALAITFSGATNALPAQAISAAADQLRQAQTYLEQQEYLKARELAEGAVRVDPHSSEAETVLGVAEYALGNLAASQQHLQRALDLSPELIAARRTLGQVFLAAQRLEDARRELEKVLASQPSDFISLYSLGVISLLVDKPEDAASQFEKALAKLPNDSTALAGLLRARLRMKDTARAAQILSALETQDEGRDRRRTELAALLVSEGAYDLAAGEFEKLREAHPDSDETNYNLALAYHRAGRQAEAARVLDELLAKKENAEFEDLRGDVEQSRGHQGSAVAAYRRAAEIEPQNADFLFDYAEALVRGGQSDRALEAFAAGTRRFPGSAKILLGRGSAEYLAGKYSEATQTFLEAAAIAPRLPEVYELLGWAYEAAGKWQDAIREKFAVYLKSEPRDARAEYFYGRILAERGRPVSQAQLAEAQRHLERAIAIDSNLSETYIELGNILSSQGRDDAALKELLRAVDLNPQSSAAYYKLSQVYRRLGRSDRAEAAAQKFQQLKAAESAHPDRTGIEGVLDRAKR